VKSFKGIECGGFSKAHRRFARSTHPTLRWLNEIRGIMQLFWWMAHTY